MPEQSEFTKVDSSKLDSIKLDSSKKDYTKSESIKAGFFKKDLSKNDNSKKSAKDALDWLEKQKLLQLSEISLVLDTYDDIFSDFDPRTFDKRSLSDDFLSELKRATRSNKTGIIELNFLIPLEQRKEETENKIKKRLRDYFRKHYEEVRKEVDSFRGVGIAMIVFGLVLSILTALFVIPHESENVWWGVLLILVEPAAWFTIWEGANKVFDTWKVMAPDLEFNRKMSKCEISFTPF
jgi:hypothetical protein